MSSEDFPALPGTQISSDGSMVMNSLGGLVGSVGGGGGDQVGGDKHVGGGVVGMGGVGGAGNGGQVIGGGGSGGIGGLGGGGVGLGGSMGGVGGGNGAGGVGVAVGGAAGAGMDLQPDAMTAAQNDKAFQRGVQTSPDGELGWCTISRGLCGSYLYNLYLLKSSQIDGQLI